MAYTPTVEDYCLGWCTTDEFYGFYGTEEANRLLNQRPQNGITIDQIVVEPGHASCMDDPAEYAVYGDPLRAHYARMRE